MVSSNFKKDFLKNYVSSKLIFGPHGKSTSRQRKENINTISEKNKRKIKRKGKKKEEVESANTSLKKFRAGERWP